LLQGHSGGRRYSDSNPNDPYNDENRDATGWQELRVTDCRAQWHHVLQINPQAREMQEGFSMKNIYSSIHGLNPRRAALSSIATGPVEGARAEPVSKGLIRRDRSARHRCDPSLGAAAARPGSLSGSLSAPAKELRETVPHDARKAPYWRRRQRPRSLHRWKAMTAAGYIPMGLSLESEAASFSDFFT